MSRSPRRRAVLRDQARRRAAVTHRWTVAAGSALTVVFGVTLSQHAAATTAPAQPGPATPSQPATSGPPAAPESTSDSAATSSPSTTPSAAPTRTPALQPPVQPPVATSRRAAKSGGS
jgi:hypothetical protein